VWEWDDDEGRWDDQIMDDAGATGSTLKNDGIWEYFDRELRPDWRWE
jgi:hypothetical protein